MTSIPEIDELYEFCAMNDIILIMPDRNNVRMEYDGRIFRWTWSGDGPRDYKDCIKEMEQYFALTR